ncbi:MAG: hypothetical protein B5M53_00290 [Candidatus Cloacimonas sp. 4484_209]|nr:MAG: hypothetical protein B5M53_00290 [Candidatus Cloacimonas sp. 4484_209]
MKSKIFLVLLLSLFLISMFSLATAEEKKLTEKEAIQQIDEYKTCVDEYGAKVKNLKAQVEPLKNAVADLDKKIADLEAQIAKLTKPEEKETYYVVKPGDWLSKLAEYPEVYGHGNYAMWKKIYNANKDLIKDPNLIYPGWKLVIPKP